MNTHPGCLLGPEAAGPILRTSSCGGKEGSGRLPGDETVSQNTGGPGGNVADGGRAHVVEGSVDWYPHFWTWP